MRCGTISYCFLSRDSYQISISITFVLLINRISLLILTVYSKTYCYHWIWFDAIKQWKHFIKLYWCTYIIRINAPRVAVNLYCLRNDGIVNTRAWSVRGRYKCILKIWRRYIVTATMGSCIRFIFENKCFLDLVTK